MLKKFQTPLFFAVFLLMYTLLDSFNMSYTLMRETYGLTLVIINITLNIVMALLSAIMISHTSEVLRETKAANASFFSILFGVLTYGCTTCVITFFASLGITFSVAVLPFAGLPYKLISLLILIMASFWSRREIRNAQCAIHP